VWRVGLLLASLLPAALLHLTLSMRVEGRAGAAHRAWLPRVAAVYLLLGVLGVLYGLSRNPFDELDCTVRCESIDPVLEATWLAPGSADALVIATGLVAVVAAATALTTRPAVDDPLTRTTLMLLALSATLEAAWAWWPGARAAVGPVPWEAPLLLAARACALGLLGGWLVIVVVLRLRRRASVRSLAREITQVTPPARVGEVIADRLNDPGVRLEYFVAADQLWVDEEGRLMPCGSDVPPRQTAVLRRGSDVVARLTTSVPHARARHLEDALGPAALLALDAERTRAEQLLRLRALQETRRLAVQRSDVARRRAERDLHDGAQHLLLATTFALQEAVQLARSSGRREQVERLTTVAEEVTAAAREVRELAHGIYPVLLGDAGIVPALEGLARESLVPVAVDATSVPRLDSSVELTVHLAAAAAVRAGGSGPVRLTVSHDDDTLRLSVAGSTLGDTDARPLRDRAEALGGTMSTVEGTWHLELPCV
jgi:signal transduction histidine kinase